MVARSMTRPSLLCRALFVTISVTASARTAAAQVPPNVRVVGGPTPIVQWLNAKSDVLITAAPGTMLEVLDKERDWYWVIIPPDAYGVQRVGWIPSGRVEIVERPRRPTASPTGRGETGAAISSTTATAAATGAGPGDPSSTRVTLQSGNKEHGFEEVHFDLNRYSLKLDQVEILDRAVTVFKEDPTLRVNIEGYTCNLGTTSYNLRLGEHRANTVRDYLLSKGVSPDRLRTASFGEKNPKYDNSREETRRLNRRVALVPAPQP